ncbi:MAG TPA: hypothetical protein VMU27_02345 [Candidatus Paceibacterota bacterium]|nr:hypothetical protein [Candidatus Paceibacterota bacterium]
MIKKIIGFIIAILVIALFLLWIFQGGIQQVEVAVGHYRNPLEYGSVYDWFFQIGTTTGETFKLPGTPSQYSTLSMPNQTTASTSYGPTVYYQVGSNGGDGAQ